MSDEQSVLKLSSAHDRAFREEDDAQLACREADQNLGRALEAVVGQMIEVRVIEVHGMVSYTGAIRLGRAGQPPAHWQDGEEVKFFYQDRFPYHEGRLLPLRMVLVDFRVGEYPTIIGIIPGFNQPLLIRLKDILGWTVLDLDSWAGSSVIEV
jgi:hypothetical protein